MVHHQMPSVEKVGQGLPPAVEYSHESLSLYLGLYLSPIDIELGESFGMYILE